MNRKSSNKGKRSKDARTSSPVINKGGKRFGCGGKTKTKSK